MLLFIVVASNINSEESPNPNIDRFEKTFVRVHKTQLKVRKSTSMCAQGSFTFRGRYESLSKANTSLARLRKFEAQANDALDN